MAKGNRKPIVVGPDGEPLKESAGAPWRLVIAGILVFLLVILVHNGAPLYTDWLWFQEVGYGVVFTTTIAAKTGMYIGFALLFFTVFYINLYLAQRLAPLSANQALLSRLGAQVGRILQRSLAVVLLVGGIFLSLWAGRIASDNWASWLEFAHPTAFGVTDPVFGNDIGFYVFQLPFWRFFQQFVLASLLLTFVTTLALHIAGSAIETLAGFRKASPGIRAQLLALAGLLALTMAVGAWLSGFDLLNADNGKFSGAGYADLHYRLFALRAQALFLAATGIACAFAMVRPNLLRWPAATAAAWLGSWLLLGNLLPGVMQKTQVEPNEFSLEREFIRRNIEFTRRGFNLQDVQRIDDFPADETLNAAGIAANRDTLENVRLWDHPFLSKVYSQLQTVKSYYKFEREAVNGDRTDNIDIDRYRIGGRLRQVMVGAREMDTNGLPDSARTWQNTRLAYTHGYGLVVSPVNRTIDGLPDYFLSGIPLSVSAQTPELRVSEPRIYYGQLEHSYIFVNTEQPEFDYPSTETTGPGGGNSAQDHTTQYEGRGGVPIGASALAQWAFGVRFGDANILLTHSFTPKTRVMFRRDIRDRIQTIAPFVQQDGDPYLVVDPDTGRLVWIVDCYTLSDQFPYSTPQKMDLNSASYIAPNYVRNSIKATVDAYDGAVNLYLADPKDPIARTYSRIFPGLIKPLGAMSEGLRSHIRYPEDLFRLQRSVYAAYHVDDPRIFYFREDTWAIPSEPNTESGAPRDGSAKDPAVNEGNSPKQMEPYYVIMRLPQNGESLRGRAGENNEADKNVKSDANREADRESNKEEFLLMSPLAPVKREAQNILGWMCARCDTDRYGQLVLYRFPQQVSVNGPSQVVAYVNNDPVISSQLTPLRMGGSTASLGNLLVIPVERSLLYIAPLYVESTTGAVGLPKLQKVVVAFGERVAMSDTLAHALAELFPAGASDARTTARPSGTPQPAEPASITAPVRRLIHALADRYDAANARLKRGDLAGYAAEMKEVEQSLQALKRAADGNVERK